MLDGVRPAESAGDGPRADHVALVLHTSGTTSRPKLVPLTHGNLCVSARNVARTLELTQADRCLNVMPLFHIHGLVAALLASICAGASIACTPGFHQVRFFDWLDEFEPTWYTAVPTMHAAVLARSQERAEQVARHRLRLVRSSSAPLPMPIREGLETTFGVPVIEAYGMTEAAHQMASNAIPPGERKPGTVGRAAGPEIGIIDPSGLLLGSGQIGEVAIRGENVFSGYEANREANETSFASGWFRTGDEGSLDERGFLTLRGRISEIINRGGEKISPLEVDDALLRHGAVKQAATFGVADPRLGQEVAAAVVLVPGQEADERALQDFVAAQLAPFKVPRRVVVVGRMPTGPTGKLRRRDLAERLDVNLNRPAEGGQPRDGLLVKKLVGIWESVLDIAGLSATDDFFALGGDSILGAEAVARVRDSSATPIFRSCRSCARRRRRPWCARCMPMPAQDARERSPCSWLRSNAALPRPLRRRRGAAVRPARAASRRRTTGVRVSGSWHRRRRRAGVVDARDGDRVRRRGPPGPAARALRSRWRLHGRAPWRSRWRRS